MKQRATTSSKLSRPRLHGATHREHLYQVLDQARVDRPCIFMTGPPGYGKTTVAATWLDARRLDGIWFQIDAGDGDLASFFHWLGLAAKPFARKNEAPLPFLTPEYLSDVGGFSRRFFRRLFERLPAGAVLVFDNYQELPTGDPLHELIATAVDDAPVGTCLIIISRREPPKSLARLLVNERVAKIGVDELRLTPEETYLIAGKGGVNAPADLQGLQTEADGWAAGLTLLIEQRRNSQAGRAHKSEASQEVLFNYFASQVFNTIDPERQEFLLDTAVLPSVLLPVAIALTGSGRAGEILHDLYERRLFVHRRDSAPLTYQYHALFRDFLRGLAAQKYSPEQIRALLVRAADLLKVHGRTEDAIDLYREGCAWDEAEKLILESASDLLAKGRWRALQQWLHSLPVEQLSRSAWAMYWLGSSEMQNAPALAREWLIKANDAFVHSGDVIGRLLSAAAILRSIHFEYKTFESMDRWITQIDADLASAPVFPKLADELALHSAVLLAVIYRLPGHAVQQQSIARVSELLDAPIDVNCRVSAAFVLLLAHTQAHRNSVALQLVERIAPCMDDPGLTALNRAYWWMLVGYLHQRRGARAETEEALNRCDRIASDHGLRQPEFLSRCFRVQHCCTWSDTQGALRALDGMEKFVSDENSMATAQYHKQRLFLEMLRGNSEAAEMHARRGVTAALRLGSPFFNVIWLSQGAAALGLNGAYEDAAAWLRTAWVESDNGFVIAYRPMILASEFFISVCRGEQNRSRDWLQNLFAITPDEDAFSYVGTMPVVRDAVLVHALIAGINVKFVQALIRKYEVAPPRQDIESWPWPVKVFTLGAFHVEVNGVRVQYSRKTPRKVLLLLKALIAMGRSSVSMRRVVDALWPDEDGDAGLEALGASLHRLRKLLAHPAAIQTADGVLSINRSIVWVDLWCFEDQVSSEGRRIDEDENDYKSVLGLYRGHFLDDEDVDAAWAIGPRERARSRFLKYLLVTGRALEDARDYNAAGSLYRIGIEADELAEDLYQGLMRSLIAAGHTAEAVIVFGRLRSVLGSVLGIRPSSGSVRLIEELRQ